MKRIILIGLSGTGKTSVARELASRIGYDFVDVDHEIATRFDRSIADIFDSFGEHVFRAAESDCLESVCRRDKCVIATGGGAVVDRRNWLFLRPGSLIVHLQATSDEILRRLVGQLASDPAAERPLLNAEDPDEALRRMRVAREPLYRQADVTIDTSAKTIEQVTSQIEQVVVASREGVVPCPIGSIGAAGERSDLYVAAGILDHCGRLTRQRFGDARRVWVISDDNVAPRWSPLVESRLKESGFDVVVLQVPAGESSKSLSRVSDLTDALLDSRIDRRDVVLALGGGVVGDLVGFVASIVLRGVGLVQVPTSLLAMVDSSVGGKTGVNHARGKNLIGTFYQPQIVIADPLVLDTLPEREVRGGWGEIVKHAMIESTAVGRPGVPLLEEIEQATDQQLRDPNFMAGVIRRNVLIKKAVVQADEKESGQRRILNYGHTLGHAMEASGYQYHHGEAVALGMRAAIDLAIRVGRSTPDVAQRQNALLDRFSLPARFDGQLGEVMERVASDKKAINGRLTWILPRKEIGYVDVVTDVSSDQVEESALAIGTRR